jgi:hypothetical protein
MIIGNFQKCSFPNINLVMGFLEHDSNHVSEEQMSYKYLTTCITSVHPNANRLPARKGPLQGKRKGDQHQG